MKNENQELHELLCAYVLGEASDDERARVEVALEGSAELREEHARLVATIGLVQDTLGEAEALSPTAERELYDRAGMKPRTPLWSRPVLQLAAAALILVAGVFAWNRGFEESEGHPVPVRLDGTVAKEGARAPLPESANDDANAFTYGIFGELEKKGAARSESERAFEVATAATPSSTDAPESDPLQSLYDRAQDLEVPPGIANAKRSREGDAIDYDAVEPSALDELGYLGRDLSEVPVALGEVENPRAQNAYERVARSGDLSGSGPAPLKDGPPSAGADGFFIGQGVRSKNEGNDPQARSGAERSKAPAKGERSSGSASAQRPTSSFPAGPSGPAGRAGGGPSAGRPGESTAAGDPESSSNAGLVGDRRQASTSGGKDPAPESEAPSEWTHSDRNWSSAEAIRRRLEQLGYENGDDDLRRRADALIQSCRIRPGETPSMMFHRFWGDNAFEYPLRDPLSTFSVDVDTASYALSRNYLLSGTIPPKAAVRTEEFVNYFDADVEPPVERDFRIHTDLAPSPFGSSPEHWMLRVVVRGREVSRAERAPLSLSFVVDTSGSMEEGGRLELVKHALHLLVEELDANDSIALVAFSNEARLVLPMTSAANRATIGTAIEALRPKGGTNVEAGLKLGYAQAADGLRENGGNRVVLLSDGVANIGRVFQEELLREVEVFRDRGIYLNTIGVGMGNHNDHLLEQLANKGDGLCHYVDDEREAERVIVEKFTGAFEVIARDAKIQVEFDPAQVERYRLLGYENRAIADEDFRNDRVDAGEVGAGHQVTALYELVRLPGSSTAEAPLATVRLRWKAPFEPRLGRDADEEGPRVTEIEHAVRAGSAAGSFEATTAGYRRAVLVAQFAEFLRRSRHARGDSLDDLLARARGLERELADEEFTEFVRLVEHSRGLIATTLRSSDELTQALDALREHQLLVARYRSLLDEERHALEAEELDAIRQLEAENAKLEEKIRELIEKRIDRER